VIRAEFEQGWEDGLLQLGAIKRRLYQSSVKGIVWLVNDVDGDGDGDGVDGLQDVEMGDEEAYHVEEGVWKAPVLCLAGRGGAHVEGCGHSVSWDIWPRADHDHGSVI
jgi:hypothetical protein